MKRYSKTPTNSSSTAFSKNHSKFLENSLKTLKRQQTDLETVDEFNLQLQKFAEYSEKDISLLQKKDIRKFVYFEMGFNRIRNFWKKLERKIKLPLAFKRLKDFNKRKEKYLKGIFWHDCKVLALCWKLEKVNTERKLVFAQELLNKIKNKSSVFPESFLTSMKFLNRFLRIKLIKKAWRCFPQKKKANLLSFLLTKLKKSKKAQTFNKLKEFSIKNNKTTNLNKINSKILFKIFTKISFQKKSIFFNKLKENNSEIHKKNSRASVFYIRNLFQRKKCLFGKEFLLKIVKKHKKNEIFIIVKIIKKVIVKNVFKRLKNSKFSGESCKKIGIFVKKINKNNKKIAFERLNLNRTCKENVEVKDSEKDIVLGVIKLNRIHHSLLVKSVFNGIFKLFCNNLRVKIKKSEAALRIFLLKRNFDCKKAIGVLKRLREGGELNGVEENGQKPERIIKDIERYFHEHSIASERSNRGVSFADEFTKTPQNKESPKKRGKSVPNTDNPNNFEVSPKKEKSKKSAVKPIVNKNNEENEENQKYQKNEENDENNGISNGFEISPIKEKSKKSLKKSKEDLENENDNLENLLKEQNKKLADAVKPIVNENNEKNQENQKKYEVNDENDENNGISKGFEISPIKEKSKKSLKKSKEDLENENDNLENLLKKQNKKLADTPKKNEENSSKIYKFLSTQSSSPQKSKLYLLSNTINSIANKKKQVCFSYFLKNLSKRPDNIATALFSRCLKPFLKETHMTAAKNFYLVSKDICKKRLTTAFFKLKMHSIEKNQEKLFENYGIIDNSFEKNNNLYLAKSVDLKNTSYNYDKKKQTQGKKIKNVSEMYYFRTEEGESYEKDRSLMYSDRKKRDYDEIKSKMWELRFDNEIEKLRKLIKTQKQHLEKMNLTDIHAPSKFKPNKLK